MNNQLSSLLYYYTIVYKLAEQLFLYRYFNTLQTDILVVNSHQIDRFTLTFFFVDVPSAYLLACACVYYLQRAYRIIVLHKR